MRSLGIVLLCLVLFALLLMPAPFMSPAGACDQSSGSHMMMSSSGWTPAMAPAPRIIQMPIAAQPRMVLASLPELPVTMTVHRKTETVQRQLDPVGTMSTREQRNAPLTTPPDSSGGAGYFVGLFKQR